MPVPRNNGEMLSRIAQGKAWRVNQRYSCMVYYPIRTPCHLLLHTARPVRDAIVQYKVRGPQPVLRSPYMSTKSLVQVRAATGHARTPPHFMSPEIAIETGRRTEQRRQALTGPKTPPVGMGLSAGFYCDLFLPDAHRCRVCWLLGCLET